MVMINDDAVDVCEILRQLMDDLSMLIPLFTALKHIFCWCKKHFQSIRVGVLIHVTYFITNPPDDTLVGGLVAINFIFPEILGISSSQLTFIFFQRGG